ncbi:MAG: hypothetical protein H6742_15250 [Alphaproteobacteria bacterium]|nr:hypothetical protein [Alphaproteobacteria bacterium]
MDLLRAMPPVGVFAGIVVVALIALAVGAAGVRIWVLSSENRKLEQLEQAEFWLEGFEGVPLWLSQVVAEFRTGVLETTSLGRVRTRSLSELVED